LCDGSGFDEGDGGGLAADAVVVDVDGVVND
jgi:hypothetical protein